MKLNKFVVVAALVALLALVFIVSPVVTDTDNLPASPTTITAAGCSIVVTTSIPTMITVGQPVRLTVGLTPGNFEAGTVTAFVYDINWGDGPTVRYGGNGLFPLPPDGNFDHTYTTIGNYTVVVSMVNGKVIRPTADCRPAFGYGQGVVVTVTAPNLPPLAAMTTTPANPYVGDPVNFNGNGSRDLDPADSIASYAWDFGDGTVGSGPKVTHSYATAGAVTATLTVTDSRGAVSQPTVQSIIVTVRPPTPPAQTCGNNLKEGTETCDGNDVGTAGGFACSTLPGQGFTDGQVTTCDPTSNCSRFNTANCTTNACLNNPAPTAVLNVNKTAALVNESLTFDASGSTDNAPLTYNLAYGDGAVTTNAVSVHAYTRAARRYATLTVTDTCGATNTVTKTITVTNPTIPNLPPTAVLRVNKTTALVNETLTFDAIMSTDPDGKIVSYYWNLGDGATDTTSVVTHAYTTPNSYTVMLTVKDNLNASGQATQTITVIPAPASGDLKIKIVDLDLKPPRVNDVVTFELEGDIASLPAGGFWMWTWEDGRHSYGERVTRNHRTAGDYSVQFDAYTASGVLVNSVPEFKYRVSPHVKLAAVLPDSLGWAMPGVAVSLNPAGADTAWALGTNKLVAVRCQREQNNELECGATAEHAGFSRGISLGNTNPIAATVIQRPDLSYASVAAIGSRDDDYIKIVVQEAGSSTIDPRGTYAVRQAEIGGTMLSLAFDDQRNLYLTTVSGLAVFSVSAAGDVTLKAVSKFSGGYRSVLPAITPDGSRVIYAGPASLKQIDLLTMGSTDPETGLNTFFRTVSPLRLGAPANTMVYHNGLLIVNESWSPYLMTWGNVALIPTADTGTILSSQWQTGEAGQEHKTVAALEVDGRLMAFSPNASVLDAYDISGRESKWPVKKQSILATGQYLQSIAAGDDGLLYASSGHQTLAVFDTKAEDQPR